MATDKRQFLNINYLNFRMWFKNELGASALYLSLRPVTVGSGRMGQNLRNLSKLTEIAL